MRRELVRTATVYVSSDGLPCRILDTAHLWQDSDKPGIPRRAVDARRQGRHHTAYSSYFVGMLALVPSRSAAGTGRSAEIAYAMARYRPHPDLTGDDHLQANECARAVAMDGHIETDHLALGLVDARKITTSWEDYVDARPWRALDRDLRARIWRKAQQDQAALYAPIEQALTRLGISPHELDYTHLSSPDGKAAHPRRKAVTAVTIPTTTLGELLDRATSKEPV